jgi:hypothetical protein
MVFAGLTPIHSRVRQYLKKDFNVDIFLLMVLGVIFCAANAAIHDLIIEGLI